MTQLIPARDPDARLQLMILIDETLNIQAIGNNLADLKEFVKAQPLATVIGIGYMASAGVHVVQQFTTNHEAAVNAIRLPREGLSTMDSPYLSLISLVKGWPEQNIRRQDLEQEKQTDQPFITACLPSDQKQRQTTTRAGGHLRAQHEEDV